MITLEAAIAAQIDANNNAIEAAHVTLAELGYVTPPTPEELLLGMTTAEIDAWLTTIPRTHWDELDAYCEQIGLAESGRL